MHPQIVSVKLFDINSIMSQKRFGRDGPLSLISKFFLGGYEVSQGQSSGESILNETPDYL